MKTFLLTIDAISYGFDTHRIGLSRGLVWRLLFALILGGCLVLTLLVRYRLIFLASSDIGGIESFVIYSVQRYLAGFPLYASPEAAPFTITQYSPLYYRLVAAVASACSLSPDDPIGIYRVSRGLSLLANLGYAGLLAALGSRFGLTRWAALGVGVVAFVLLPPHAYSRPDSVCGLLSLLSLYAGTRVWQAPAGTATGWLLTGMGAAALAIATKQSGIVLPAIWAGYYCLFRHNWAYGLTIGAATGAMALVALLGLMPEHDPALLYANIVTGVSQGFDWAMFKVNIYDHYLKPFGLHNALGLVFSVWLLRQPRADQRWLGWSALMLFAFALLTSTKQGSALNYFTDYVSLTGLVVMVWISNHDRVLRELGRSWPLLGLAVLGWAVLPNVPNFNWPFALSASAGSEKPYQEQQQVVRYLHQSLGMRPTDAVFVTNYNYCYLNGLLYRNCLLPQQEIVAVMYPRQTLDYSALDARIRQGRIRFLITRPNEQTTAFAGLTTTDYTLRRRFADCDVYERTAPGLVARR